MPTPPPLTKPTIHLNGSGRDRLSEALEEARAALRKAIEAVQATAPNGRDYYPQGPDAIRVATIEHGNRMNYLQIVDRELAELHEHVVDS